MISTSFRVDIVLSVTRPKIFARSASCPQSYFLFFCSRLNLLLEVGCISEAFSVTNQFQSLYIYTTHHATSVILKHSFVQFCLKINTSVKFWISNALAGKRDKLVLSPARSLQTWQDRSRRAIFSGTGLHIKVLPAQANCDTALWTVPLLLAKTVS